MNLGVLTRKGQMKTKEQDYVEDQNLNSNVQGKKELTTEEQFELFAELLIDQLLNSTTENEN